MRCLQSGTLSTADLPDTLSNLEPHASVTQDELGDPLNSFEDITTYNNYYEFTTDKGGVSRLSQDFDTVPWQVKVGGLVNNPKTYDIVELIKNFTQEERIYRLRCVEAWSMVIPWVGFPIAELLKEVDPKPEAKYVHFQTVLRPDQMPGQKSRGGLDWPYVEGLRIDEAMNPLAIFATGMYGKPLVAANGAPIRVVVPWKYGFKSIKGIVQIDLVEEMPVSSWMNAAPNEYGFYSNVNPEVSHPRWSQATERRIGEFGRRDTLKFNGYEEEVAYLYEGMDLTGKLLMKQIRDTLQKNWLWIIVNVGALLPLLWLAWDILLQNLVDPVGALTLRTGKAAIILLILSLAVTPINFMTGYRPIIKVRKSLGLFAFLYVSLHLLVFVGLDYGFNVDYILRDGLPQKPYIVVGFIAFLILIPLAITSTKGWMKRLGRNWKRLHKWVYLVGVLAVLHYIWVEKIIWGEPLLYAAIVAMLLLLRLPPIRRRLSTLSRQLRGKQPGPPPATRSMVNAEVQMQNG